MDFDSGFLIADLRCTPEPAARDYGPVIIDGYSQAGAQSPQDDATPAVLKITLRGHNTPGLANGLVVSGGSTIKGLVINAFGGAGIAILAQGSGADHNVPVGNFVGIQEQDREGGAAELFFSNGADAIAVVGNASKRIPCAGITWG